MAKSFSLIDQLLERLDNLLDDCPKRWYDKDNPECKTTLSEGQLIRLIDLLEHYPDRWRDLKEIQAICDTDIMGNDIHTLQHLYECMEQELNNSFFKPYGDKTGMDEYACSRWEKMLGIIPSNEATVDDRQFAICTRLFLLSPYTIESIEDGLAAILGERATRIKANVETKEIAVLVNLESRFKFDTIVELMDAIVPANMKLTVSVDYTTFQDLEDNTHVQLEKYEHDDIPVAIELQDETE